MDPEFAQKRVQRDGGRGRQDGGPREFGYETRSNTENDAPKDSTHGK